MAIVKTRQHLYSYYNTVSLLMLMIPAPINHLLHESSLSITVGVNHWVELLQQAWLLRGGRRSIVRTVVTNSGTSSTWSGRVRTDASSGG